MTFAFFERFLISRKSLSSSNTHAHARTRHTRNTRTSLETDRDIGLLINSKKIQFSIGKDFIFHLTFYDLKNCSLIRAKKVVSFVETIDTERKQRLGYSLSDLKETLVILAIGILNLSSNGRILRVGFVGSTLSNDVRESLSVSVIEREWLSNRDYYFRR